MPIQRLASRCNMLADRFWPLVLVLFSAAFFSANIAHAGMKLFWHDEIYTVIIASLPSFRTIWTVHETGADIMPPLNSLLTHGVIRAVGVNPVSARLTSMLG